MPPILPPEEPVAAAVRDRLFTDLAYPNDSHRRAFTTYATAASYAYHFHCRRIFEIGSGLSTAMWAQVAEGLDGSVTCVDIDFDRFRDRVADTDHADVVAERVEVVHGTGIDRTDLEAFLDHPMDTYTGVAATDVVAHAQQFVRTTFDPKGFWRPGAVLERYGPDIDLAELLLRDGRLVVPTELAEHYANAGSVAGDLDYLSDAEAAGRGGIVRSLLADGREWDMVFLDSGELVSMVEWMLVRDCVAPGGLVVLHDVFFPKSLKNVVVAGAISASPDWDVLHVDETTIQGLMVARRVA